MPMLRSSRATQASPLQISTFRRAGFASVGLLATFLCLAALGQDADTLRRRLQSALEGERWEQALSAALGMVALDPSDPTSHYNAACVLALMGESNAAVEALGHAAELGFSAITTFRTDSDLESLRGHPGYAAALERVEETHAREYAVFKKKADRSEPLIYPPPAGKGDAGQSQPLIVLLHGRGGRAQKLARLYRPSAAKIGAVLVVPEAFEPFGDGFQWGRVEDALYRVEHAIEFAAERHEIDRRRVIVAGFSQGAYLSLVGAARDPRGFAGVLAIGACDVQGLELAEVAPKDLPPIYLGIGSEDRGYEGCGPLAKALEAVGFKVKFRVYKGYGHVYPQNYVWEIDRALRFVLENAPGS